MKISSQEEYGIRCLLKLAFEPQPLTISDIAVGEGLSQPYVGKLLALLRQAGLIRSERGRCGGYRLAMPPEEINLRSVMEVLGEPLFEESEFCQRHSGTETDGVCVHQESCGLRVVWSLLGRWTDGLLERITLADLVGTEEQVAESVRVHLMAVLEEQTSPLVLLRPTVE